MRETMCFVAMPFRPELNYFYLYLKKYLEETYRIQVERGDTNFLTKELLKKISEQISDASFLIADITGNNANVFFELGIAYEKDKPIVFLTQDDPRDAPVDTRQYEFIRYDLGKHQDFLPNAVRNLLVSSLDIPRFYRLACELLAQFNLESGITHRQISRDEFHSRIVRDAQVNEVPWFEDATLLGGFLLPELLKDADADVMGRVTAWLKHRGGATG